MVDNRRMIRRAERWFVLATALLLVAISLILWGVFALGTPLGSFLCVSGGLTALASHGASKRSSKLNRRVVRMLYPKDESNDPD